MDTGIHVREHTSVLAGAEKRLLVAMARRMPRAIGSDHLTALGALAMVGTAAAFAAARLDRQWLLLVPVLLAVNWFGDSLDGTVARVRGHQRPRYGYYLDHVVDLATSAALFAGMALSGLMQPILAVLALHRLHPAVRRVVPGHAHRRHLPPRVLRDGAHGTPDPAGGRRARRGHAGHDGRDDRRVADHALRRGRRGGGRRDGRGLCALGVPERPSAVPGRADPRERAIDRPPARRPLRAGRSTRLRPAAAAAPRPGRVRPPALPDRDGAGRRGRDSPQLHLALALDLARPAGRHNAVVDAPRALQRPDRGGVDRRQRRPDGRVRRRSAGCRSCRPTRWRSP